MIGVESILVLKIKAGQRKCWIPKVSTFPAPTWGNLFSSLQLSQRDAKCSTQSPFLIKESGKHPHSELNLDLPVAFHFNTREAQGIML